MKKNNKLAKLNKKISVTVAIPAYNEAENIADVLNSVIKQKHTNHKIDAICVYSDGSSDETVNIVKNKFKSVKLFDFKKNEGKNKRVNQIMTANKSDVLIQVDADIQIKDANVFNYLIDTMIKYNSSKSKLGIVCSYHLANKPKTFIGSLAYFGFEVWDKSRNKLGNNGIRYYCEGGLRAFTKDFTKVFKMPYKKHVGEDSYSFYFAKTHGFEVLVSKKAKVYIYLPETIGGYINQMKRFLNDPSMVENNFNEKITSQYETMTSSIKLQTLTEQMIQNPINGVGYVLLQFYTKTLALFYKPEKSWQPIERKLNK